jgi:hypothetical protein
MPRMADQQARRRRMPKRAAVWLGGVVAVGLGILSLQVQAKPSADERARALGVFALDDRPIPDDSVLLEQLHDAIELRRREDFDRVLDARDPGELIEHATLTEMMFERAPIGIDALFIVGDELFGYAFRPENGWGAGGRAERTAVGYTPRPSRIHRGESGGPDAFACLSCHFKGGPDGAGMQTQNAFLRGDGARLVGSDQRNPPHLLGLGPVQALAREMSAALQKEAAAVSDQARAEGRRVERDLVAQGVAFGRIAAEPDGTLDRRGVEGVDRDLVVRAFGWKGHQESIRAMAEESFHIHQGLVSMGIQNAVREGRLDGSRFGKGSVEDADLDDDGVAFEVDAGMLSTMVGYLSQLEVPVIRPPRDPGLLDAFAAGRARFDALGCATCHVPTLELGNTNVDARLEPGVQPKGPVLIVDVAKDGDGPKIEPKYAGPTTSYLVHLFSDLKRHDMGEALASPSPQGAIPSATFLTRSLWGLAETAPYLHDGRAPTVHEAIVHHGGEGAAARDAYLALDDHGRAEVRVFLTALSRRPKLFVP